jgi:MerR family transcriptional regulator, copper efflux regulator
MSHANDTGPFNAPGCTLSPDGLTGRVNEWREVAAHALRRRVEPGRVVTSYPNRPELAQRLTRLIAAERQCCPFLDFTVRHDEAVIAVELRYPPQFADMLATVLDG